MPFEYLKSYKGMPFIAKGVIIYGRDWGWREMFLNIKKVLPNQFDNHFFYYPTKQWHNFLIYSKNPYIGTKKLRTFEAEIFCYAPSKQKPSPAWIWIRFLINEVY